jgi:hypothetical protein
MCFRVTASFLLATLIPVLAQTTEDRLSQLEARVKALEDQAAKTQKVETLLPSATGSPSPIVRVDVPIELINWNVSFEIGSYNQARYKITYTVKNTSSKGIRLNQSRIIFRDLLGEKVYSIKIDADLKMPAGKNIEGGGYYSANPFIPDEMRLKGMAKENIKAEFFVGKVVFDDGSLYEGTPQ